MNYETEQPNLGLHTRWDKRELDTSVSEEFDPNVNEYINYLEKHNLKETEYFELFKIFGITEIDLKKTTFENYLQYLIDKKKIQGNRKLYSHICEILEYFVSNNLLHINKSNDYIKTLNIVLYSSNKTNKSFNIEDKHKKIDYSEYEASYDFREVYTNQLLNELHAKGGEIYFNNNNKFYIKLREKKKLIERPKRTVENILSRVFGFKIQITDEPINYKDYDMDDFIFKASSFEVNDTNLIGGNNE